MIIISILLSLVVVIFDLGAEITFDLIFLVIGSFIMGQINIRFTCLAYVVSALYLLDLVITLLGIKQDYLNLPYEKLILLVGITHVVEGIMAYLYGDIDNASIVNYKEEQIIGGYKTYRRWYIPLFLFKLGGVYLPIICVMGYCDETYTTNPSVKTQRNGITILIYGLIMIYVGMMVLNNKVPIVVAMIIMPLAHELQFVVSDYLERKPYMYSIPSKGVRIMEVSRQQETINKIERGDIVLKVNGKEIQDEESYYKAIDDNKLIMILKDLAGNKKILYFDKSTYEKLEIIILPTV